MRLDKKLNLQIVLSGHLSDNSKNSLEQLAEGFQELGHQVTLTRSIWQNDFKSDLPEGIKNWFVPSLKATNNSSEGYRYRRYRKLGSELLKGFDLTVFGSLEFTVESAYEGSKGCVICWVLVSEIHGFSKKKRPRSHVPLVFDSSWSLEQYGVNGDIQIPDKLILPPVEDAFRNPSEHSFDKPLKGLMVYEKKNHQGFFNVIHALGSLFLKGRAFPLTIIAPTLLADCGLGEKVVISPDDVTLARLMKTHHLLLLPGDYSSGMLLRGMASGMACFASPRGISADLRQQQDCLVVPEDSSPESWSVAISDWMEKPEELQKIGESARMQGMHWTPIATASQLLEAVFPGSAATTDDHGERHVEAMDIEKRIV